MKQKSTFSKVFLLSILYFFFTTLISQAQTGTLIIVRHAEKETIKGDPPLSSEGYLRAEKLNFHLENIQVDALFSTQYKRTKQTLEPLARTKDLEITLYEPKDLQVFHDYLIKKTGSTLVVAGHSNTVPQIINHYCKTALPHLQENEYDNLFIISLENGKCDYLLLKY